MDVHVTGDMNTHSSVLIVDDDYNLRKTLSDILKAKGYTSADFADAETALAAVRNEQPAVALVDLQLPDLDGLELIRRIRSSSPATECIVLTGHASQASAIEAVNLGAYSYVQKPYDMDQLLVTIRRAVEKRQAEEALKDHAERLETLHEIDRAIIRAQSPQEIARIALRCVRKLIPCLGAAVVTLDLEACEVTALAVDVDGEPEAQTTETCLLLEMTRDAARIFERLRRGEFCVIREEDLGHHAWIPQEIQNLRTREMDAVLGAPLVFQDALIGVLALALEQAGAFSEKYVEITQEVANQLAVAIQNARLHQQVRQHAESLAVALARQKELDRLKDQFIQNVSHELRSPLALIRCYAEMLANGEFGELKPSQRKPISTIVRRCRMLSDLVEDITFILEAQARPLERDSVPLAEVAGSAIEDFHIAAEQAGLKLRAEIPSGLPPVDGSLVYLRRVIDNLLSNAIKFTPRGGEVVVRMWQEEEQIALEVRDTGIGIPADQLDRIFERFYQVDGSARRKYGGMGLGLALVAEIVDLHGGRVTVQSQLGKGSTFTVTLPIYKG